MSSVSRAPGESSGSINNDRSDEYNSSSGTGGSIDDSVVLNSEPFPSVDNALSAWGAVDSYSNDLMMGVDVPDALHNDPLGRSLHDFTSLDFGDLLYTNREDGSISTLGSSELENCLTPATQTHSSHQFDASIQCDNALMSPAGSQSLDCSREASDILRGLSFLKINMAHSVPGSVSTASTTNSVPFDRILHLNRESSERLGRLLTCSCARCPHHALLYASIISLILTWYQEAAGCTQTVSWSPAAVAADTISSGSISGFPSPWSSTSVSTVNTGGASTPTLINATAPTVAPTQMAIGSFNIDDQQVQTALRIQLLLGESRGIGSLIDRFTSLSSSSVDDFAFSSVDSLYKSLSSWLRREHSRMADIMRSQLKEVSI